MFRLIQKKILPLISMPSCSPIRKAILCQVSRFILALIKSGCPLSNKKELFFTLSLTKDSKESDMIGKNGVFSLKSNNLMNELNSLEKFCLYPRE